MWILGHLQMIVASVQGRLCLGNCECYHQPDGSQKIQCDNKNNTDFILASNLPENTGVISFRDNKIQQLPNQPTGHTRRRVWNIDLAHNNIEGLLEDKLGKTFPNLSLLDLSSNLISFLSNISFQHLAKLKVLYLSNNNLRVLNQDWFSYLLKLSHLYLNHNKIKFVNTTRARWPMGLSTLDLSENCLKVIPPLPAKASMVNLNRNPVYCGCNLDVNKDISETFIQVECSHFNVGTHHSQSLSRKLTNMKLTRMTERRSKFVKYRSEGGKCQSAKITIFSYVVDKGKWMLNCITTYGYPDVTIHVYHEEREIMKSQINISLAVQEAGIYICKVSNYISHDKRQLNITSDNDFNQTTFSYIQTKSEITSPTHTDQPNANDYQGKGFIFYLSLGTIHVENPYR